MESPIVNEIQVKSVLSKSNLPVCEYSVNPYVGCPHACKYCYASFMKRFTNHPEPWGEFLDVKYWAEIKNPQKIRRKRTFYRFRYRSIQSAGGNIWADTGFA